MFRLEVANQVPRQIDLSNERINRVVIGVTSLYDIVVREELVSSASEKQEVKQQLSLASISCTREPSSTRERRDRERDLERDRVGQKRGKERSTHSSDSTGIICPQR